MTCAMCQNLKPKIIVNKELTNFSDSLFSCALFTKFCLMRMADITAINDWKFAMFAMLFIFLFFNLNFKMSLSTKVIHIFSKAQATNAKSASVARIDTLFLVPCKYLAGHNRLHEAALEIGRPSFKTLS